MGCLPLKPIQVFFFLLQGSFRFLTGCFLPPFVSGLQLSFLLEKFIENVNGLKG